MTDRKTWKLVVPEEASGVEWTGPNFGMRFGVNLELAANRDESQSIDAGERPSNADRSSPSHREDLSGEEGWQFAGRKVEPTSGSNHVRSGMDSVIVDQFDRGNVRLCREIAYDSGNPNALHIRLSLENTGKSVVRVGDMQLVSIAGAGSLRLGEDSPANWSVYRSGRQKNDLPSVCRLGHTDIAFRDSIKGVDEYGQPLQPAGGPIPSRLVSDELTVIQARAGHGPGTLLAGFLTPVRHLVRCTIGTDAERGKLTELEMCCLGDGLELAAGDSRAGEWLRLDARDDVFSSVDEYTRLRSAWTSQLPDSDPPSVYCTWYYYGFTIDESAIEENLESCAERSVPIDVFQLDDGWARRWGNWEANDRFPLGMGHTAERIKEYGYRPGIWTAPFIVEPRCALPYYHPEWLLRRADGVPVRFRMDTMENFVLDPTHPGVVKWLIELYRKLDRWGYTYHKLDFTRAVALHSDAVYHDRSVTRAEAYRRGIEAVRRGAGDHAYIVICGGLYGPSSGLVDAQRTGSDVLSQWPSAREQGEEVAAPNTVKQNILRYWMNSLWHNDADALMVRRRSEAFRGMKLSLGLLNDDEACLATLNQYFGGGLVSFTEPMKEIDADRIGLLRHIIPSIGSAAIPRDMMLARRYPSLFDVTVRPKVESLGKWHTVTAVNWAEESTDCTFTLDRSTLGEFATRHERFVVSEFWSGEIRENVQAGDSLSFGTIYPHSNKHFRIAPCREGEPMLVYANGHFAMGATECIHWEAGDGRVDASFDWPWTNPLRLAILAPTGAEWTEVSGNAAVDDAQPRLLNIVIESPGRATLKARYTH